LYLKQTLINYQLTDTSIKTDLLFNDTYVYIGNILYR